LAFSTCPPWPCAASFEMARTCAGLPFRLRLGSGDLEPDPRDLRLSYRDAFRFARSSSLASCAASKSMPEGSILVSARSAGDRDSSHGVVNDRPSIDMPVQRPLPVANWLRGASFASFSEESGAGDSFAPFGSKMPPFERVPSLPFLPASTVCSAGPVAGLLHPAADHGVRHVSGLVHRVSRRLSRGEGRTPGAPRLRRGSRCRRRVAPRAPPRRGTW